MLSEYQLSLICHALDGPMTADQREELRTLLADSSEARTLYLKLRSDRRRIRRLPRQLAPATMADAIMRKVIERQVLVLPKPSVPRRYRFAHWLTIAMSVVVMFGLVAVYLQLTGNDRNGDLRSRVAKRSITVESLAILPKAMEENISKGAEDTAKEPPKVVVQLPAPTQNSVDTPDSTIVLPPMSNAGAEEALAAPYDSLMRLFKVEMPKLPPIIPVGELGEATRRAQLMEAIQGQSVVHIDLFCSDTNSCFERLSKLLEQHSRPVLIDSLARLRLRAKLKTDYVLVSDWNSPDELENFLRKLPETGRSHDGQRFDSLVPLPMSAANLRTLATLLGVEVKALKPAIPQSADPRKPLSDLTVDELARSLEKREDKAPLSRPVLAVSYNPVRPNPAQSREIREYLSSRPATANPASILAMVVLRNLN
jgi:hypothetical protein